jgi:hypothetical protein
MENLQIEKLTNQYEQLTENSYYNKGAYLIADAIGLKMKVGASEYKKHFIGDTQSRYVFKITLNKDGKQYTFNFGQSIAEGSSEPTLYNVLACLQKYDVGTFEDFCGEFGYELSDYSLKHNNKIKATYKVVVKEFEAIERLFNSEELELLSIIS